MQRKLQMRKKKQRFHVACEPIAGLSLCLNSWGHYHPSVRLKRHKLKGQITLHQEAQQAEFRSYLASVSQTVGSAAPQFSQPLPASLQSSVPVDRSLEFAGDPNVSLVSHKPVADTSKSSALSGAMQRRSQTSTALTRVRISSQSPMDFFEQYMHSFDRPVHSHPADASESISG